MKEVLDRMSAADGIRAKLRPLSRAAGRANAFGEPTPREDLQ